MSKVTPCLWFASEAEEAVRFYTNVVPNSGITHIQHNLVDGHSGPAGSVLVVDFTLNGQRFLALNGGIPMEYTHAVSFQIECATQAEVDHLSEALSDGGSIEQCGWLKDRYGVSWQIVPRALIEMLGDRDTAKAARVMAAMMQMVKLDIAALKKAFEG
jgi:predicted 3-demethylubiquinone-9 3-methyltransferase (glyoxalase superfamily)